MKDTFCSGRWYNSALLVGCFMVEKKEQKIGFMFSFLPVCDEIMWKMADKIRTLLSSKLTKMVEKDVDLNLLRA